MNLLDSSALLAYLQGEPGADVVAEALRAESSCSAANWSEVAQKSLLHTGAWLESKGFLLGLGVTIEPVTAADAERAAELWQPGRGLPLADRLCLATGERLDAIIWTADAEWGSSDRIRQIR